MHCCPGYTGSQSVLHRPVLAVLWSVCQQEGGPPCRHAGGLLPLVFVHKVPPTDAILGCQIMRANRASGAVRVCLRRLSALLEGLEHRREELPCRIQLIIADKQPVVACSDSTLRHIAKERRQVADTTGSVCNMIGFIANRCTHQTPRRELHATHKRTEPGLFCLQALLLSVAFRW